jgi:two-component system NtrC family response regulator/two-component system response regulator HydG
MTAYGTVKTAVRAMKMGAEDYLGKPIDVDELEVVLKKVLEKKRLLEETKVLRDRLTDKYDFDNLVGQSPRSSPCSRRCGRSPPARRRCSCSGESGTGKELFAQAIHENSPRRGKAFIKVACAALPETLLESELFGHEKGSFTGAMYARSGRFEMADGGTLFLDEIGDITPTVQVKLLGSWRSTSSSAVGGNRTYKVDVRVVAATHRDLSKKIEDGTFREDLYYRLNVIEIHIPSLRERTGDIPLLAHHFLHEYATANKKDVRDFSDDVLAMLLRHNWPGNVRELQNAMERAVVLATEPVLTPEQFPTLRRAQMAAAAGPAVEKKQRPGHTRAARWRRSRRKPSSARLEAVDGSTSRAADLLQISARKIQYKLKEYQQAGAVIPRDPGAAHSSAPRD